MAFDDPDTMVDESAPPMGGGSMIQQLLAEIQADPMAAQPLFDALIDHLAAGEETPPEEPAAPMGGDDIMPEQLTAAASPTNVATPGTMDGMDRMGRRQAPVTARNGNGHPAPRGPAARPTPTPTRAGNGHAGDEASQLRSEVIRLRRQGEAQGREIANLRAENEQTRRDNVTLDRFSRIQPILMEIHRGDEAAAIAEADQIVADTAAYTAEQFEREVGSLTRLARAAARPSNDRVHQHTNAPNFTDPTKPLPNDPRVTPALQRFGRKWAEDNGVNLQTNHRAAGRMLDEFKAGLAKGEIKL